MNASFGITHADPLAHVVDWADLPAAQQPTWPDAEQARQVQQTLRRYPRWSSPRSATPSPSTWEPPPGESASCCRPASAPRPSTR